MKRNIHFMFSYLLLQSVTATATQTSVTLTWRCIWRRATPAVEFVITVCTTQWDATVRCANRSTTKTLTGISGTLVSVLVRRFYLIMFGTLTLVQSFLINVFYCIQEHLQRY